MTPQFWGHLPATSTKQDLRFQFAEHFTAKHLTLLHFSAFAAVNGAKQAGEGHGVAGYLDQLLQQRLEVLPDCLVSAQLQVAQGLGVESDLGGSGVLQHLATQPHRQVVVDTNLLDRKCRE